MLIAISIPARREAIAEDSAADCSPIRAAAPPPASAMVLSKDASVSSSMARRASGLGLDMVGGAFAAGAHQLVERGELRHEIGLEALCVVGEARLGVGDSGSHAGFETVEMRCDFLRHPAGVVAEAARSLLAAAQQNLFEGVETLGQGLGDPVAVHADGGHGLGRDLAEGLLGVVDATRDGVDRLAGGGGEIAVHRRRLREQSVEGGVGGVLEFAPAWLRHSRRA